MTTGRSLALWMLVAASPGCGCDLDHEVTALAGDDAVDCGSADGARAEEAWACAVEAFENDEAFTVSWTEDGIDSTNTYVLVSDGEQMWQLAQDDYKKSSFSTLDVHGWDCVSPYIGTPAAAAKSPEEQPPYAYVACTRLEPEGNHYQVCGKIEGGNPEPLEFDP